MIATLAATVLAGHMVVLWAPALMPAATGQALLNTGLALLAAFVRHPPARTWLAPVLGTLAGVIHCTMVAAAVLADRLPAVSSDTVVNVQGVIDSVPRRRGDSLVFIFSPHDASGEEPRALPRRVEVSWYRPARIPAAGQRWALALRLKPPRGQLTPGGFDREAWLFRQRIGAVATVYRHDGHRLPGPDAFRPLLRFRADLAGRISRSLDGDPAAGIVTGLAVGLRHGIDRAQRDVLRRTGTGHLVAISGLHVGLVAGLVFAIVSRLSCFLPALTGQRAPVDVAWLPALAAASAYALLAGFALPTRRALLMLALWYLGRRCRRPVGPATVVGFAVLVNLGVDALGPLDAGFWLSYVAVTALLLMSGWHLRRGTGAVVRQLGMFAALAPVSLLGFGQLAPASPVANLLMIPWFSLAVIPTVLAGVAMELCADGFGAGLFRFGGWLVGLAWPLLEMLSTFSMPPLPGQGGPFRVAPALVLLGLLAVTPRWAGKRMLAAALVLALVLAQPARRPAGWLSVTALDVGHGLALVVRTAAHALVYDTGPGSRGQAGGSPSRFAAALEALGVHHPDVLVLSHNDSAHTGAAREVLAAHPAMAVLTGAPLTVSGLTADRLVTACEKGIEWRWDGVEFRILAPAARAGWEDDDASCVLRVSTGGRSLLITGDLTRRGERALMAAYPDLRAEVVAGLRHGSGAASSDLLVSALGAGHVIVSTAWGNRWGLPSARVVQRWRAANARVADTGVLGTVSLTTQASASCWRQHAMRVHAARIWRFPPLR